MEMSLIRKYFNDNYTIGRFGVSNLLCDSLEDPIRELHDYNHDGDATDPGEGKIPGQTAIPAGRYQVIVTYSPKFQKRLPELLHVPYFTNIRIHSGANAKHTEGCILIGENRSKGTLTNGPYYVTKLIQLIDEASERGETTFITIKQ